MCASADAVAVAPAAASVSDCRALSFAIAIASHETEATAETLRAFFCVSVPPPSAPPLSALSDMKSNWTRKESEHIRMRLDRYLVAIIFVFYFSFLTATAVATAITDRATTVCDTACRSDFSTASANEAVQWHCLRIRGVIQLIIKISFS